MTLVLASASAARQTLLANAGLDFSVRPATLDEREAEKPLLDSGAPPEDIALALAMAKAASVSEESLGDLVIGADQTLDFEGERLTKPADRDEAVRQLLRLSGKTHQLHSAVAVARDGDILWHHIETATLTMRALTPQYIGRYLGTVGPAALQSVGGYQLEGRGIQLFDRIEGDFFTILGLPMLPLLGFLRREGVVE